MMEFSSIWQKPSFPIPLDIQAVHVWCASTAELSTQQAFFKQLLSPAEITRAEKYVFDNDRERFILARGFLRHLLSQYLNLSPKEVEFNYSAYGKPAVVTEQNSLALTFNVSDSKDFMLFALSREASVGVDVEFMRTNIDVMGMAKHFFSVGEYQTLMATKLEQQYELFFQIWTRKEALIKNIGLGLYYPVQEIEVLHDVTIDTKTGIEYRILSLPLAENYQAALSCDKDISNENIFYWRV